MKQVLFFAALFSIQPATAQSRLVSQEAEDYYAWFQERSQTAGHYVAGTTLRSFSGAATIHEGPCREAAIIGQAGLNKEMVNLGYGDDYYLPEDEINGYGDFWYHVKAVSSSGKKVSGYVWGGDVAKAWAVGDVDGDGKEEHLLLGLASRPRASLKKIEAELKVVGQTGQLVTARILPGLCIFEDCGASVLLRTVHAAAGFDMIEASTVALGCWAGIEKAYYSFDGSTLSPAYYAEYTTGTVHYSEPVVVSGKAGAQVCTFSTEDKSYDPIWSCEPLEKGKGQASAAYVEGPALAGN